MYSPGTGYDLATGLGSPVANLLIPALAGTTQAATHFVVTASPTSVTAGANFLLIVEAEDSANNVVTGYDGSPTLSVTFPRH